MEVGRRAASCRRPACRVTVRARRHEAEVGALGVERLRAGRRVVGGARRPAVRLLQHVDRQALAAEAVVHRVDRRLRAVRLAERHRERVDDVLARRGGAPGVVAPVAEQHVQADAGEGRAARVDARARARPRPSGAAARSRRSAGRRPRSDGPTRTRAPTRAARSSIARGKPPSSPPGRRRACGRALAAAARRSLRAASPCRGRAAPRRRARSFAARRRYGKRLPCTVTGASGSSAVRRSRPDALAAPACRSASARAWSSSAESSSRPPPLPKIPPIRLAVAITSVTFQSCGPAACRSPRTRPASSAG